jgi:hypothetical protein
MIPIIGREAALQRLTELSEDIVQNDATFKEARERGVKDIYEGLRGRWVDTDTEEEHIGLWSADPQHETVEDWLGDLYNRCSVSLADSTAYDKAALIDWLMGEYGIKGLTLDTAVRMAANHQGAGKNIKDAPKEVRQAHMPELDEDPEETLGDIASMPSGKASSQYVRGKLGKQGISFTWAKIVHGDNEDFLDLSKEKIGVLEAVWQGTPYQVLVKVQTGTPDEVLSAVVKKLKRDVQGG